MATMTVPKHDVYQAADQGPFRCDNCEYFSTPNKCSNPEIVKLRGGMVEPGACCDYFENKGTEGQQMLSQPRNGPMALSGLRASLRTSPDVPGSPNIQGSL